jgi:hypothetical protein
VSIEEPEGLSLEDSVSELSTEVHALRAELLRKDMEIARLGNENLSLRENKRRAVDNLTEQLSEAQDRYRHAVQFSADLYGELSL